MKAERWRGREIESGGQDLRKKENGANDAEYNKVSTRVWKIGLDRMSEWTRVCLWVRERAHICVSVCVCMCGGG